MSMLLIHILLVVSFEIVALNIHKRRIILEFLCFFVLGLKSNAIFNGVPFRGEIGRVLLLKYWTFTVEQLLMLRPLML